MKVLIVINDLESGGAQKSLVSFLRMLEIKGELDKYDIDLFVASLNGIFVNDIPKAVKVKQFPLVYKWMNYLTSRLNIIKDFSLLGLVGKISSIIKRKLFPSQYVYWNHWKKYLASNKTEYDVAISYMDGWPNYYIIEKVNAKKKVLWIHNEYKKLNYDPVFDTKYYNLADSIITISDRCKDSFLEVFPHLSNKIRVLENITIVKDIVNKSNLAVAEEFENSQNKLKLLSVGRLNYQKSFDLAVKAAYFLKRNNINFVWVILGEGEERENLEKMIREMELDEFVYLPGVKSNPYPYLKSCDIFVQTSIFEGKSIVLDEAKIFAKPIVVTNYETVYDNICSGITGYIVEKDGESIADGIVELAKNDELKMLFVENLKRANKSYDDEIYRYIEYMFL